MKVSNKLYAPYQVLGLVNDGRSTACRPTVHRQGLASFITTPVDDARALHLYDINLRLKRATSPLPSSWLDASGVSRFSAIAAYNETTFVALGPCVAAFFRFQPFCLWHIHEAPITQLYLAANVLVSIAKDGRLVAWLLPTSAKDRPDEKGHIVTDLRLPSEYQVSCIAHPQSYQNKILLGTKDGRCILLNLKSGNIIHVFPGFGSAITVLEPAPVLDVVAVGTVTGDVHLHNFRVDETVVTFKHSSARGNDEENLTYENGRETTAISFRTDSDESVLTADGSGNMYVWDLNDKSLRCDVPAVHGKGAMFARFFPGEPLLLSAGAGDNSVKLHIFEDVNGQPRILRSRDGHKLPPMIVRFSGFDGLSMVSAGLDREVRLVSAVNQARNRSFAQRKSSKVGGSGKKRRRVAFSDDDLSAMNTKLPPVTGLVSCDMRERDGDYANIVTVHEGMQEAHTWRLQHGVEYKHILKPPERPERLELAFRSSAKASAQRKNKKKEDSMPPHVPKALSAAVSPCGTFAIIGMEDGRIHCYNLQSGRHQGVFDGSKGILSSVAGDSQTEWGFAHYGPVVGLAVDAFGDTCVSAGSNDRMLKFWHLHTGKLNSDSIQAKSNITHVAWCGVSDLVAVACEDFGIYVFDAATRKLARQFFGHRGPVVDLCFDPFGRRVVSAASDSTIRVWDLPSGCLVDTLRCSEAPTSIAMGPSGDYLATTHVNNLSVRMWVDRSRFGASLPDEPNEQSAATTCDSESTDASSDTAEVETSNASFTSKQRQTDVSPDSTDSQEDVSPLSNGVITLSKKPASQWTILANLKEARESSKPSQAAKKPTSAPFFLPTKKGLHFEFDFSRSQDQDKHQRGKKRPQTDDSTSDELPPSTFGRLVIAGDFDNAAKFLRGLDPSSVDVEIRTVGGELARRKAAEYFTVKLASPSDYELSHAHLNVFLRCHGTTLAQDSNGADTMADLLEAHRIGWERLRASMDSVACLSAYFSGQV